VLNAEPSHEPMSYNKNSLIYCVLIITGTLLALLNTSRTLICGLRTLRVYLYIGTNQLGVAVCVPPSILLVGKYVYTFYV
jgi:hypothetical protein